jgi:2-polyprenyl-6-methoxyphenol hydroxylase-like FAD-dependent oxidoreductase
VKILQLIPPEGWRAVLVDVSDRRATLPELCAWALVEDDEGETRMVGMVFDSDGADPYPVAIFPKYNDVATVLYGYSPPGEEWDERDTERALRVIEQREPIEWREERLRREERERRTAWIQRGRQPARNRLDRD